MTCLRGPHCRLWRLVEEWAKGVEKGKTALFAAAVWGKLLLRVQVGGLRGQILAFCFGDLQVSITVTCHKKRARPPPPPALDDMQKSGVQKGGCGGREGCGRRVQWGADGAAEAAAELVASTGFANLEDVIQTLS